MCFSCLAWCWDSPSLDGRNRALACEGRDHRGRYSFFTNSRSWNAIHGVNSFGPPFPSCSFIFAFGVPSTSPVTEAVARIGGEVVSAPTQVVGQCECGCASIDFAEDKPGARIVRDAIGRTASGIEVGALLWSNDGIAAGLEIYMLGVETAELPIPESLQFEPFGRAS